MGEDGLSDEVDAVVDGLLAQIGGHLSNGVGVVLRIVRPLQLSGDVVGVDPRSKPGRSKPF